MKTPFNMIINGPTNCGKTYYLLKMLEEDYMGHFSYIVLICPTFSYNKTYMNWDYIHDPDFISIECKQEKVEDVLKFVTDTYKGSNTLIILDDCAASKSVKNRVGNIVELAFSARHFSLSTIVITQQLTSIAKPYRENLSKLVTFYNPSRTVMKTIIDEYLYGVPEDTIAKIIEILREKEYARLEIQLRNPYSYELT